MENKFEFLTDNKMIEFEIAEVDFNLLSRFKILIQDLDYFDFVVESQNCGFFFGQSLQLYSFATNHNFNDIDGINALLKIEYENILDDYIAFGQDIFGTQFCFKKDKPGVFTFNCETGEKEQIALSFVNWIDLLNDQLEYLTGVNLLEAWYSNNKLNFDQRLYPKKPFIMGGEFKIENLYASTFPAYFKAYANIARQVYNLPNGTKVTLKIQKGQMD